MPALEVGATKMEPFAFQKSVEDFSVEMDAQVAQQHDTQGRHTDITADSLAPNVGADALLLSAVRMMAGPLLMEADGNPNGTVGVLRVAQITSTQHNYNPDGLATAIMLELESDADRTITGIVTERRRRWLCLLNRGNYSITLTHNSGSSTAGYRFAFAHNGDYVLRAGGIVWLYYDPGSDNWRGDGYVGIKLIQSGTVSFTNGGSDTPETTITGVDLTKAVLLHQGEYFNTNNNASARVYFSDSNHVAARRDSNFNATDGVVGFMVVEYY